jgi:hypothetical protein
LPNPFGEGEVTHWYHPLCGAYKRPQAFLEAFDPANAAIAESSLLLTAARDGVAHRRVPRVNGAERDPSGRAHCRSCKETIAKGTWRIRLVYFEEGRYLPSGAIHARCAREYFETTDILPRIQRFAPHLSDADLTEIRVDLEQANS